ncbi:lysophospholipid acyltransferase family protein [Albimonas sp. CAU 1670]|uniref:lysophospholipid acyltransferase family protein n=1 Tax=Albimonas sp. CAU 1670 TaxID=3032599 RepID=UPI0023DCBEE0|nr:lysophospholipid acyltransferase family protein [Albimonas sp. CAU 1670]MDF2231329.1 lysophospholipid acyltransferase family protein [Albimonas sp. CAU 1670]
MSRAAGRPRSWPRRILDRIEMAGARLLQATSLALPGEGWAQAAGRVVGPLWPGLVKRVAANLALVRPGADRAEARRLTAEVCGHFARAAAEYLDLERIAADPDRVAIEDAAPLRAALASGRGVVLVTAHFGNWESIRLAVRRASAELEAGPDGTPGAGRDCALIYRAFNNPLFDAWSQKMIAHAGTPVLHKGRDGTRTLLRHVARKGVALILVDQRQTGSPLIPFLGHEAETALAAAELALRFDAALIPARGLRLPDGRFSVLFEPEIPRSDAETMMAEVNARLGAWVERWPEQWFWLHRRWKTRPRGERIRAARGETG